MRSPRFEVLVSNPLDKRSIPRALTHTLRQLEAELAVSGSVDAGVGRLTVSGAFVHIVEARRQTDRQTSINLSLTATVKGSKADTFFFTQKQQKEITIKHEDEEINWDRDLLPPFTTISLRTTGNRVRGGLFANAHGDEAGNDNLILCISDLDESLWSAGTELFETTDGFLGRGEGADGVDCKV